MSGGYCLDRLNIPGRGNLPVTSSQVLLSPPYGLVKLERSYEETNILMSYVITQSIFSKKIKYWSSTVPYLDESAKGALKQGTPRCLRLLKAWSINFTSD